MSCVEGKAETAPLSTGTRENLSTPLTIAALHGMVENSQKVQRGLKATL